MKRCPNGSRKNSKGKCSKIKKSKSSKNSFCLIQKILKKVLMFILIKIQVIQYL